MLLASQLTANHCGPCTQQCFLGPLDHQRRLEAEPELMVKWAEEALLSTRTAVSLTLVIHPETLAKAGEGFEKMVMTPGLPEKTRIETDEKIARDEVIVRQTGGEIQAGLTAQLDRLEELLQ